MVNRCGRLENGAATESKGENFGPTQIKGYWSVIHEGDDWKIRMAYLERNPSTG